MGKTRVRDARPLPAVCLSRADLAVLGERVEPRRLPAVRSTLLALLELAGEPEGSTKGQLAARAGVGTSLLNDCMAALEQAGLVRTLEDGSLMLSAPSGQETLPVVPEAEPRVVPPARDEMEERAKRFIVWHAARIGRQTGSAPAGGPAAIAAAKRILGREPDSGKIKARIEWALAERFYADKVGTMQRLDTWWARVCLAFDAAQGGRDAPQAEPGWRAVSYDTDRVQVA